ncbi:MAG: S1C family serine protease [Burkholderiales bacterium]
MRTLALLRRFGLALFILVSLGEHPMVSAADLPDTIDRIRPSIVAVGGFKAVGNPPFTFRGTGFVVADGTLVATNAHVVADPPERDGESTIAVQFRSGDRLTVRRARIVATASDVDLAVLRIEGAPLAALPLAGDELPREGREIAFTGFPVGNVLGVTPVTHRGIVSSIAPIAMPGATAQQLSERQVRRLRAGSFNILQLDATAYPGNSGSPVFDVRNGQVVGIINMVLVRGTREAALSSPTGISYAIPVLYLTELLRSLRP